MCNKLTDLESLGPKKLCLLKITVISKLEMRTMSSCKFDQTAFYISKQVVNLHWFIIGDFPNVGKNETVCSFVLGISVT